MITINYFSHLGKSHRHDSDDYWKITSYFLNKIKPENKEKIFLNILATKKFDWSSYLNEINHRVYEFTDVQLNYMEKVNVSVSNSGKYAIKLDEDCFISNYVWDFIIENIHVLDDDGNFIITPMLSNGIPHTDRFVDLFIEDEKIKEKIYNCYLKQNMPNGLWGADYTSLNQHTIKSIEWNSSKFFEGVSKLDTHLKGIHPIRICAEAQVIMNDYILENFYRMMSKKNYNVKEFTEPYYTTSMFAIKTEDWKKLLDCDKYDSFDEIQLNLYKHRHNKKFLYVENGFGIHTIYNTLYGNKNRWNIGMENGISYEKELVEKIRSKCYDTLYWR